MITNTQQSGRKWSEWIKKLIGSKKKVAHPSASDLRDLELIQDNSFESEVKGILKRVIDPELEINIVDLGLIYKVEQDDANRIFVEMTLSTPACPIGDVIVQNVIDTLQNAFPSKNVDVSLVFDPPWHPGMLSEVGKKALQGNFN